MNLALLLAQAPCTALFPTQAQAKAARKRLYRLGAKAQGLRLEVQGCELRLVPHGPVAIAPAPALSRVQILESEIARQAYLHPNLTPAELRAKALAQLGLEPKEPSP